MGKVISKDGYFKHTPVLVQKIALSIKGLIGILATATYFSNNEKYTLYILIGGWAIDELLKFVKEDERIEPTN